MDGDSHKASSSFGISERTKTLLHALKIGLIGSKPVSARSMQPSSLISKKLNVEIPTDDDALRSSENVVLSPGLQGSSKNPECLRNEDLKSPGASTPNKRKRSGIIKLNIPDDGHMWHKYGQKNIVGTQKRRNYYRCSLHKELGCPAKRTIDFHLENTDDLQILHQEGHSHLPRTAGPSESGGGRESDALEDYLTYCQPARTKSSILEEWEIRAAAQAAAASSSGISQWREFRGLSPLERVGSGGSDLVWSSAIGRKPTEQSCLLHEALEREEEKNSKLFKWLSFESIDSEQVKRQRNDKDLSSLLKQFTERTGVAASTGEPEEDRYLARSWERSLGGSGLYLGDTSVSGLASDSVDYFHDSRPRKSPLLANRMPSGTSLAPLPANRPPSSKIRTPVGHFQVYSEDR